MMVMRMAFSWTCQPKRKEHKEMGTRAKRKVSFAGLLQTFHKSGAMVITVSAIVTTGGTSGRTKVDVEPTSPLVAFGEEERTPKSFAQIRSTNM